MFKADTNTCSKPIPILAPSRYHTDSTADNETNIFPELILCQLLVKIYRYLPKVLPICKSLTNIYTIPSMYLSDNQYTYPQQIYWLAYIKFPETGISVSTKFIGMTMYQPVLSSIFVPTWEYISFSTVWTYFTMDLSEQNRCL